MQLPPLTRRRPSGQQALAQAEYAAELRAQIAAKEQRRQRERANSLCQSAALLELNQGAGVLPSGVRGGGPAPRQLLQRDHLPPAAGDGFSSAAAAGYASSPTHQPHLAQGGWDDETAGWPHQRSMPPQRPPPQRAAAAAPWEWASEPLPPSFQQPAPDWGPAADPWQQQMLESSSRLGMAAAPPPRQMPPVGYPPSAAAPPPPGNYYSQGGLQRTPSTALQPPYGTEQPYGAPAIPQPPQQWRPAVAAAPFGTDFQPQPGPPARSVRQAPPGALPGHGVLPSWAAPPPAEAPPAASPFRGSGRMADIGAEQEGAAARAAQDRKRAIYKAELEQQMQLKEERRCQVGGPAEGVGPVAAVEWC